MPTHNYSAIPAELRALKQWIVWRYEDKGGAKKTKVPYSTSHNVASVTNSSDWDTFDNALWCLSTSGAYDGIGFVFTKNDPYAGIDLDDCEGNQVDFQRQLKIFNEFDSYSERSPSGNGCHVIVKGSIPQGRRRSHIEIYSSDRYFTMTGNVVNDKPIADKHDLLNQLFTQMGGGPNTIKYDGNSPQVEDDGAIIKRAMEASNGERFMALHRGEFQTIYASQSEADFAYIDIIAFYTQNREQIIRIFRNSPLGQRDKAKRADYVNRMVNESFDRLLPQIDVDGFRIQLEKMIAEREAGSVNGKPAPFEGATVGSNPTPAANSDQMQLPLSGNGPVAQRLELVAHNGLVVGSNPTGTTSLQPPPGLMGDIARFIYEAAPRQVPEIAIAGAIGLMAGICGRAYNISGTGLNMYVLLLAKTGTGKESIASGIDKIINQVSMSVPVAPEFVGPSEIASGQALIKYITNKSQSFVSILGEFGIRLQIMSDPRANGADKSLRRTLLDLYGKSGHGQVLRPSIYADKEKNTIEIASPAFSILAESTPETLYEVVNESMIKDGLLPRFMILEYTGDRPLLNKHHVSTSPSIDLVDKVAQLMANAKTVMANKKVINVECTGEVVKLLDKYDEYTTRKINTLDNGTIKELWNRAHLKIMRLSALVAIGCHPLSPMITEDMFNWSRGIIEHEIKTLSTKFESGEVGQPNNYEQDQQKQIKRVIRDFVYSAYTEKMDKGYNVNQLMHSEGIVPYSYLNSRLPKLACFANDKIGGTNSLKRTIQTLIDSGYIVELSKKQMNDKFGQSPRAYMVQDMGWLGEPPEK